MTVIIIFTTGYLIGGVSALFLLGMTVAARRADHGHTTPASVKKRV